MWRIPRNAQTTIPCTECGTPLKAERSCRDVTLSCAKCRTTVDLAGYADKMDAALEDFLSRIPCDRM